MASLSLKKKAPYYPPLPGNLDMPGNLDLPEAERFHLLITSGLTTLEVRAVVDAFTSIKEPSSDTASRLAESIAHAVELGPVPLTLDGVKVETLAQLLERLIELAGLFFVVDLFQAVNKLNTTDGQRAVFTGLPSGGTVSTASETAAGSK
jgi:hypothetical protein